MSADLLLTYYGDDFSGSTDVMEALTLGGVPTVLFLQPPTTADLERFPECRAVGVAGISRGQSPAWMDEHLPPVFTALRALGARLCHYKVCSTFDSSPEHGSIGRAVELGMEVFGAQKVPLIVGAPVLRRYVVFGNLFATVEGETYRIDRHPTMSRHPVTPMREGDLRRHFGEQSGLATGLVDILALRAGRGLEAFESNTAPVVFFDTFFDSLDESGLREAGRAVWESRVPFIAGSSGVEYALLAWWQQTERVVAREPAPVDRLLVVSGSCSPVTAGQIQWALGNGFTGIAVNAAALALEGAEYERVLGAARQVLSEGGSPVIYSAMGPADVVTEAADFGQRLGARLGALAGELVRECGVRRTVIAGGDTSGHAGRALGIYALTLVRPYAPGSPLCRIWSADQAVDGGELLLKGGQVGGPALFGEVRAGS